MATALALAFRVRCIAEDINLMDKAIKGEGSYGSFDRRTSCDQQKQAVLVRLMDSLQEKRELEQQLQQLQQPHQAHLSDRDSGEVEHAPSHREETVYIYVLTKKEQW